MTRAIHRAQRLLHGDQAAAVAAIRSSGVRLQAPDALELIVRIYAPAMPATPEVSAAGALRELELFPGRRTLPDLGGISLEDYIDNSFARRVAASE
jgi:hypothetical protein